jgi:cell division protein FtsI (penicillin-binding protein 3)
MPRFRTVKRDEGKLGVRRLYAVGAFFAICFGLLVSRSIAFHLKDNGDLQRVAMRQYRTAVLEKGMRGKILDAAGREMAIDVTVDSAFASPRDVRDAVAVAEKLSGVLRMDRGSLLEKLSSPRKFVWIKRRIDASEAEAIRRLELPGISLMKETQRSYPNGTVGASMLGAVGFDAVPLGGIELAYDSVLTKRERSHDLRRDARGHLYLAPEGEAPETPSQNVELTIDKTLEYIADRALARGVETAKAKGGQAVVVDVKTGAVLAIANMPTFDPNDYEKYPLAHWRNSAIVDPHEPGSTFKTIIISSALDAGVVKPGDIFDCEGGKIKIGVNIVNDSHPHGKLSVADIVKVSSNIGAYKVEQRLGPKRAYEAIRAFGFGAKTGIDLPGESEGLLSTYTKWSPIQFATIAFGQGIAVTPLQMAMAFAAIANGGQLLKPYVVKRITGEGGTVLSETRPQVAGEPLSPEGARVMTGLLRRVVEQGGTGTLAASLEYPIAGKTGTAQKADPRTGGYARGRYYASFVGFAPADAPRIAVFVGIDEPRGAYYGGQVAAPIFRTIAEETLHYLKVPASLVMTAQAGGAVPPAAGDMDEVAQVVSEEDGERQVVQETEGSWRLPDFRGLTMRGVLATASDADIDWNFVGTGIAVRQEPEPGSALSAGERCTVEFKPLM